MNKDTENKTKKEKEQLAQDRLTCPSCLHPQLCCQKRDKNNRTFTLPIKENEIMGRKQHEFL